MFNCRSSLESCPGRVKGLQSLPLADGEAQAPPSSPIRSLSLPFYLSASLSLIFPLSLSLCILYISISLSLSRTHKHTHRSSGSESVEADVLQQMDSALVQGAAAAAAATFVAAAENSVTLLVWKVREWRAEGVGDG